MSEIECVTLSFEDILLLLQEKLDNDPTSNKCIIYYTGDCEPEYCVINKEDLEAFMDRPKENFKIDESCCKPGVVCIDDDHFLCKSVLDTNKDVKHVKYYI